MAHSFSSSLYHCVFSTRERQPALDIAFRDRLWAYMGGIARENGIKAIAIGGVEDHAHLLLSLPATLAVSKAMQLIKGGSSLWLRDGELKGTAFAWQEGYGAFTIGRSQVRATVRYIENQEEHHRTRSFQEEFIEFLKRNDIPYDPRYTWG